MLRLKNVTDSSQGIIPYKTEADGKSNLYIRPLRDVPNDAPEWKPLLDSSGFIGRYELRAGKDRPHLKYGNWLWCEREARYFDRPKLLYIAIQNQSVKRRLKAVYDESGFYNRHNFNNIIADDANYDLKYLLALFNSQLLNYWYRRTFTNVNINPNYVRELPIFPADATTQSEIAGLVDRLLAAHRELNRWRFEGTKIKWHAGELHIELPFDSLVAELQLQLPSMPTLDLRDARVVGHFSIPTECDRNARLGGVKISDKFPTQISLKFRKLWLDVPDADIRRFLVGLLSSPLYSGQTWNDLEGDEAIRVPESPADFARFWNLVEQRQSQVRAVWDETQDIDRQIDERVLDLYGIANPQWRAKILDSAPIEEEAEIEAVETE